MLYASKHEQDSTSPQQSTGKVESVLPSDVDLIDVQDEAEHELKQHNAAANALQEYRAVMKGRWIPSYMADGSVMRLDSR